MCILRSRVTQCVEVCCSVLQCVTVCCSVLQCVAVCCSALQCVAVCYSMLQYVAVCCSARHYILQKRPTYFQGTREGRTGWRRPIGCLICIGHFPQKSPIISSVVAENDLQLKAFCASLPHHVSIILMDEFPQNSHVISGSFAERDLQLEACCLSSPPCTAQHSQMKIFG